MNMDRPPLILIVVFTILLLFLCSPVQAQNVSFSNLNQIGDQDILIYSVNATVPSLVGTYNTSQSNIPIPANDFIIVVKPSVGQRYMDPSLILTDLVGFAATYAVPIILIVFFIGLLWRR